jgi:cytochrome d ubiquinol oxidase subunit II
VAIGALVVLRSDARELFDGLTSGGGLVAVLVSGAAGTATLALVWMRRFGPARLTAAAAVAAVTVGWALAQDPYVLPNDLTLDQAAASDATLRALVVSVGVGFVIAFPFAFWANRYMLARGKGHALVHEYHHGAH